MSRDENGRYDFRKAIADAKAEGKEAEDSKETVKNNGIGSKAKKVKEAFKNSIKNLSGKKKVTAGLVLSGLCVLKLVTGGDLDPKELEDSEQEVLASCEQIVPQSEAGKNLLSIYNETSPNFTEEEKEGILNLICGLDAYDKDKNPVTAKFVEDNSVYFSRLFKETIDSKILEDGVPIKEKGQSLSIESYGTVDGNEYQRKDYLKIEENGDDLSEGKNVFVDKKSKLSKVVKARFDLILMDRYALSTYQDNIDVNKMTEEEFDEYIKKLPKKVDRLEKLIDKTENLKDFDYNIEGKELKEVPARLDLNKNTKETLTFDSKDVVKQTDDFER